MNWGLGWLFIVFPSLGLAAFGGSSEIPAEISQVIVAVYSDNGRDGDIRPCTGVIVSPHKVVTAAHCVNDSSRRIQIYRTLNFNRDLRLKKLKSHLVHRNQIFIHPDYNSESNDRSQSDLAVLKYDSSITPLSNGFLPSTSDFVATGYSTGELEMTTLTTILGIDSNILELDQSQGHGICRGDSGGPLFLNSAFNQFLLLGIAIYAVHGAGQPECSKAGGFLLLTNYLPWIESINF